jgi:hypothetical protein
MAPEQFPPIEPQEGPEAEGNPPAPDAASLLAAPPEGCDPAGMDAESAALHATTDLTGQMIGHYRVGERLGGGAMATVYHAFDQIVERPVALKLLLPGADAVMRERFRREARVVSTLDHPHIVRTYQVGQTATDGIIYIAMELVEGTSLAELLEQQGKLTAQDACRVLAPIAGALGYAHAQGIVHRDVKPSNILLRRAVADAPGAITLSGLPYPVVPLLSDFGIARALDAPELTSAGRTIGTPAFMAPEQCAGASEIDGRADIYALGAVLYRTMVGRPPFSGSTTQILHAHVYDPLLIPEGAARSLPPAVIEILRRAMMKEPDKRYPRVELMAHDLAAAADLAAATAPVEAADEGDPTVTMAVLPATRPVQPPAARVLVPATPVTPRGGLPIVPRSGPAVAPHPSAPKPLRPRKRPIGALILGGALVILVLLMVATFLSGLLPSVLSSANGTPVAQVTAPPTTAATQAAPGTAGTAPPRGTGTPVKVAAAPPASSASMPQPALTPTPAPPPAVPLASAWDDAQAFFDERDWQSALEWLIIVRRIDGRYEAQRIDAMLVTSYVGLATEATLANQLEQALDFLDKALELQSDAPGLAALRQATVTFAEAAGEARGRARRSLRDAHADYAAVLMDADLPCVALEQITAASLILAGPDLLDQEAAYRRACNDLQAAEALDQMEGSILYSAQEGDTYRIFRMPVGPESTSQRLIEDAAQPQLSPDRRILAYYSTRPNAMGLYGYDLAAGLTPDDRGVRYAESSDDARDAPASWNAAGTRLAFGSTRFGDGRYRVYLAWSDGSGTVQLPGYGEDPIWHPTQELLVYNSIDDTGTRPGLWLTRPDGTGRTQLTDNGNDRRPVWTPDGRYVVFMSSGRDGNWELYRIEVVTGEMVRLTDHPAQDGLPTVSPDGKYVAFMSDRDGYWRIWYVALDGGEARPLGRITGEMPKWLEHAIQWVR